MLERLVGKIAVTLIVVLLFSCAPPRTDGGDGSVAASEELLEELFDEVWQRRLAESAYLRFQEGLPVETLDDLSWEAFQEDVELAREWLGRLEDVDLDAVPYDDRVSAEALRWDLEIAMDGERWFWHGSVLTPYSSPLPVAAQIVSGVPVGTGEERATYLALLGHVPGLVADLEERVRGQAERGVYLWRANFEPSLGILRSFGREATAADSGPFTPVSESLEELDPEVRDELLARVAEVQTEWIAPAVASLLGFLESADYESRTYQSVGAGQLPDGEEYYRFLVRRMTTMDAPPEEIHRRGLELVAEMEAQMARLREEAGFEGTREEFRRALRTDPRYFPESADEVAARLMAAAEDMEEVVDDYFLTRPEAAYGVQRLDASLEGSQTFGFYRPPSASDPVGRYHYNGSGLDQRSWLNLRGISLHELIPGHHFHIARQRENEDLPEFRRNQWHGAYTEGWGSYASFLGLEAGIYEDDPLSEYGMLMLEVFLANRLVVDPGMNLLGWSLEEAREFMAEHTLESPTQIATETLRYAADMPGQALGYQMGKLKLLELRRRAEEELGEELDLRAFHEALLEHGSLPMVVLERHIDRWIERQRSD